MDKSAILFALSITLIPSIYTFQIYNKILRNNLLLFIFNNILILICLIGIYYLIYNNINKYSLTILFATISPFIHWKYFRIYLKRFINKNGREPIDVVLNFNTGLDKDRFFALTFTLVSMFSSFSAMLIGLFILDKLNK
jgi:hypothetical protein